MGRAIIEEHMPEALGSRIPAFQLRFFRAARAFLAAYGSDRFFAARLPRTFKLWREDGKYDSTMLYAWFDVNCRELCRRFDERNGNGMYSQLLDSFPNWI